MSTPHEPPRTGIGDAFAPVLAGLREQLAYLVDVPVWSLDESDWASDWPRCSL